MAVGPPPVRASSRPSAASAEANQSLQVVAVRSDSVPPWPASIGASTEQPSRPNCSASGRTSNGVPVMPCRHRTPRRSPAIDSGDLSPVPARKRSNITPTLTGSAICCW